jgi:hypothetical protein
MARRAALPLLLTVVALLAPMTIVGDSCADCLWVNSPGCCLSSCCPCCVHGFSTLTVSVRVSPGAAWRELAGNPAADLCPAADPRDVFHVPKSLLA